MYKNLEGFYTYVASRPLSALSVLNIVKLLTIGPTQRRVLSLKFKNQ